MSGCLSCSLQWWSYVCSIRSPSMYILLKFGLDQNVRFLQPRTSWSWSRVASSKWKHAHNVPSHELTQIWCYSYMHLCNYHRSARAFGSHFIDNCLRSNFSREIRIESSHGERVTDSVTERLTAQIPDKPDWISIMHHIYQSWNEMDAYAYVDSIQTELTWNHVSKDTAYTHMLELYILSWPKILVPKVDWQNKCGIKSRPESQTVSDDTAPADCLTWPMYTCGLYIHRQSRQRCLVLR